MAGQVVAEGVVVVDADAKGVGPAIVRDVESNGPDAEKAGRGIGAKVFGGILAGYAAIGGTQAIFGFFSDAITGASDLEETLSKSSVIFGANAGMIESWGDTAATTVGLSKEAAVAAAASFGDMFTQIGFTGDAAAQMSKDVVQAAADLGSFSNLDTADVADRISAAFRGEYDSLQAVIPNINAARVESEALAMTGKDTAASLTAQEKAAAVLAIVQKDGARAMGDFERTSDGAANRQKILTAEMENQTTRLGSALLPAWTNFLGLLNDVGIPAFSWMVDNLPIFGSVLGGLAVALIAAFAPAIWGAVTATWAFTTALLANPITWVILGITALVAGIIWLATQTTFFQDVWTNVTTALGAAWTWLYDNVLSPVFSAIGTAFTWLYDSVIAPVASFITDAIGVIGTVFSWLYDNVIMPVVTAIMLYIGLWAAAISWLWENAISPIFGWIGTQARNVGLAFTALWAAYVQPAINLIGGIISWIWGSIISPVFAWIGGAVQGAGMVFSWLWNNAISPAINGIAGGINWVWGSIISPTFNAIRGAVDAVGGTFRAVFGAIGGFIQNAFAGALNAVRGPVNGIIGLVNSAIRGLNGLSVTIPDWVPVVGGQTWGLNLGTIPMLATGGVITGSGSVLVGERGPEILNLDRGASVIPLDRAGEMSRNTGGDAPLVGGDLNIYEAEDPLGSAGRVAAELRKFRKR